MISFKKFLIEDGNVYEPQPISSDEFIEWCEANCPRYLENISNKANPKIYRGAAYSESGKISRIDTNKFNRKSANTENFYTIWMDNHPDWSSYPKRSKSLICSTDYRIAQGYGDPYLIFPADKNKIGICPGEDLWFSFQKLLEVHGVASSMNEINRILEVSFAICGIDEELTKQAEDSYNVLTKLMKMCTPDKIKQYDQVLPRRSHRARQIDMLVETMEDNNLNSLYDVWEECMNPQENHFSLKTAGNFEGVHHDVEVWVQGECCLMHAESLIKLRHMEPHLYDFFKTRNLDKIVKLI